MPTLEDLIVRIEADARGLRNELRSAEQAAATSTSRMSRAFGTVGRGVEGLRRGLFSLRGALVAAGVGLSIRQTVELADTYKLLNARIRLVSDSADDARDAFERLFKSSQEIGADVTTAATIFQRTARSRGDLGVNTDQLLQFTQNLQKAVIISGATTQEANAALIQLSQGIQSNRLGGEELRSVMEQLPIIARMIADEMGVTLGQFRELAHEGKVTADVVLRAVLRRTEEINQQFEQVPTTVGRSMARLQNEFLRLVGFMDSGSEASARIAESIDNIAATVGSPEFQNGAANFAENIVTAGEFLVKNKEAILGALVGFKVGGLPGAVVGGVGGAAVGADDSHLRLATEVEVLEEKLRSAREARDSLLFVTDVTGGLFGGALEAANRQIDEMEGRLRLARANLLGQQSRDARDAEVNRPAKKDVGLPGIKGGGGPSKKEAGVIAELRFEAEQLQRTSREQFIYTALKKSASAENSATANKIRELAGALFDEVRSRELATEATERATQVAEKERQQREEASKRARELISARNQISAGIQNEIRDNKTLLAALGKSGEEYERQKILLEIINAFRREGVPLVGQEIDRARELAETLRTQRDQLREAEDASRDFRDAMHDAGSAIGTAFEDALISGGNFRDLLRGLEDDLLRIGTRLLVTKPLEKAVGGMIASAGGESDIMSLIGTGMSFFGGGGGTFGASAGSLGVDQSLGFLEKGGIYGPNGHVPLRTYASGGIANSPQMAVFGEGSRPEAFVPLPDGRRIPVQMSGGAQQQSPTANVSVVVNATDAPSFLHSRSQIESQVGMAVSRSLRRNR